jgi:phenylpropionate dioxygenase-like ring-hydroxylating dioxygenase large terminal subunit
MRPPVPNHSKLNQAFFDSLDSSVLDVTEAQMLPPACYVSDEFYEFEKQAIFDHEWLCVGRESWAPKPGDYFTSSHINEPIVVVRGHDGILRAFSNVCQHRAMLVAEGHGNARALLCQYHHWSYGLDGRLVGAPAMEKTSGFDKKCIGLPELKTEIWLGFVFINFDNDAPPLTPRLKDITAALRNYDLESAEGAFPADPVMLPWNWKVMMENNNDGYHANKLHAGPLHDIVPSHMSVFPDLPEDAAGYFRFNGTKHKDAGFNPTNKALLPIFPKLAEEERSRFVFGNVPPTLSLVCMHDMVTYMILHSTSTNEVAMTRGQLFPPGTMQQALFQEKLAVGAESIKTIVAQDLHVDALVPIGLRSRYARRGRYSWQEKAQRELNNWLVQRYRRAWNQLKSNRSVA